MHQFLFHLGTINYCLTFINGKSAEIAKGKFLAARRDDPEGLHEITDDYAQNIGFKPCEVKSFIVIDREREQELAAQNKLHDVKTNLKIDQRISGDVEIQTAARAQGAINSARQGLTRPGGNA